jgi:hypothetical protein
VSQEADGLALVAALRAGEPAEALRERAGATAPEGLEHVHPSWLGPEVLAPGPAGAYLARARTAHLCDMPADLPPAPVLEAALVELGLARLAASLTVVPAMARAQVARGLGVHADALMALLAKPVPPAEASLAVRELAGIAPRGDQLLLRAAARHLGPAAQGNVGRQLAQRLPRPVGEVLLAELGRGVVPVAISQAALAAALAAR